MNDMKPLTPEQNAEILNEIMKNNAKEAGNHPHRSQVVIDITKINDWLNAHTADPWISVEDRLPEITRNGMLSDNVLVHGDGKILVTHYIVPLHGEPYWRYPMHLGASMSPSHWMPLPEPPEDNDAKK